MGGTAGSFEAARRRQAGHAEILGETIAKFEFFQRGWNPYSRFLDVDKVDLILRRPANDRVMYREIQVKFGKLYRVGSRWEQALFDLTTWRFFKPEEFDGARPDLFVAYVMSEDDEYRGDIFIFPVEEFSALIASAPRSGERHKMYISHDLAKSERWVLRRKSRQFDRITSETCIDVSKYRRNFDVLENGEPG